MRFQFKGDAETGLSASPHFFDIDGSAEYIRVDCHVPESCFLQWYLYNPSGILQGQAVCMGGGKTSLFAPGRSVPYGASGSPLTEGRWTLWAVCIYVGGKRQPGSAWMLEIACGTDAGGLPRQEDAPAFRWLEPEGRVSPAYRQRVYSPGRAWYRGDFHVHTTCSDGKMPPLRVRREAEDRGLDFFAVTEHNFFHTGWVDDAMPVIPGMELTLPQGHFNIFAPESLPLLREGFWPRTTQLQEFPGMFFKECRESGALISVNHPFMAPWEVKDPELDLSLLHAMEIICDPTWSTAPASEEKALKAFGILWDRGFKVTGIGGSDIHNPPEEPYEGSDVPGTIGLPFTWALADELSIDALLKAVAQRRVCVTTGFRPEVFAQCGAGRYPPGSRLPVGEEGNEISVSIGLPDIDGMYRLEFVEDGAVKETAFIDRGRTVCLRRFWNKDYHWLRVDIRNASGRLCGFANPFYAGDRKIQKMTWGELVELVG